MNSKVRKVKFLKTQFVHCKSVLSHFIDDRSGATAIEYAMIASGISIVIITSVYSIGSTLNTFFGDVQDDYRGTP